MPALRPKRADKRSGRYFGLYALHMVALVLTIIGYYSFTATDTTKYALQNAIVTTDSGAQSNQSSLREDTNTTWSSPPSITLSDTYKKVTNSVAGHSDAKVRGRDTKDQRKQRKSLKYMSRGLEGIRIYAQMYSKCLSDITFEHILSGWLQSQGPWISICELSLLGRVSSRPSFLQ